MPKISIIMPVYNAESYLSESLDSVIKQSFVDIEVICINDGSTDKSLEILNEYKDNDDRIRVINQDNKGGSAARNVGVDNAVGEYIMFLDADDIYARDVVMNSYDRAVNTGVDVVLYDFARFVGKPTVMAVRSGIGPGKDIKSFTKDNYAERFFNDFATITWNKLVKRSVIVDNNIYFDVGLSHNHDVDFSVRLMLAARTYSWINGVGYYYRDNDSGITATKRSNPTNVLKILANLNKSVIEHSPILKKSFDNYAADMVAGTLEKYSDDTNKQKEVFDFSQRITIPAIGLNEIKPEYIYSPSTRAVLYLVMKGDYSEFKSKTTTIRAILRARLRKAYDVAQRILSAFTV